MNKFTLQWQIQDFSDRGSSGGSRISQEGGTNLKGGGGNLLFGPFFPKTAWKWKMEVYVSSASFGSADGVPTLEVGVPTYYCGHFPLKLREIWKKKKHIKTKRGAASLVSPWNTLCVIFSLKQNSS